MFVRAPILVLATVASAIANPSSTSRTVNQCNTGQIQCCDDTMTESDTQDALAFLGLSSVTGLISPNCNPIVGVLGGSGSSCTTQAVCCTDTKYLGGNNFGLGQVIGLDCSPINVGL